MTAVAFTLSYSLPKLPDAGRLRAVGREWGAMYLDRLNRTRLSGRVGDMGLNRISGNLSRDWNTTATVDASGLDVTIQSSGVADAYAGLQERGGTVRPTRAKWLWIPLAENKTSEGVARITPSQAMNNGGFFTNARNGGKIFWAYSLTVAGRKKAKGGLVPLFALKKEVKVPARMGATSLFESLVPMLGIAVLAEVEGAWNRAA